MILTCQSLSGAAARERPNVVVILTDDQGWGDHSRNGNTNLHTPHIDRLAQSGAEFENFYVCPVCSPTRAEFLTGRYHPRGGVSSTGGGGERLDLDERTIAEAFRAAGYRTAAFGKWHNGMQPLYHPNARGFEEFYGFCSGHWGDYFSPMLEHNGELVTGNGFVIDDFTDRALAFIEAHRHEPFFVYLPYNTPHSPMQVPDRFWEACRDRPIRMTAQNPRQEDVNFTRAALAMCENIDWNVGRLLARLDELQLAEETIVVYFCDNGPNSQRWNGEMRGRKGSTDEGGVRSPLFIRWPGRIPPQRLTGIAGAIDLLPTLTSLAGIPRVGDQPLDGLDLAPHLLQAGATTLPERRIFSHWNGKVSVRTSRYRLDHEGRLYDIAADRSQQREVTPQLPDVAAELRAAVAQWSAELLPGLAEDRRPFTIGAAGYPLTQLPARDGTAHGTIQRSNKFPNCSYFTHWTSTADAITWDVEVLTAGTYEVEMYYTCPATDAGAALQLSFRDRTLPFRVTVAHDPPLQGMQHDRVPRVESYVKEFRPCRAGRIALPAGRGELKLVATEIPGQQAPDFRLLLLRRVE